MPIANDAMLSPSELRVELESAARSVVENMRTSGAPVVPAEVAGHVLERHQHTLLVKNRIEWLWRHIERFVAEECCP